MAIGSGTGGCGIGSGTGSGGGPGTGGSGSGGSGCGSGAGIGGAGFGRHGWLRRLRRRRLGRVGRFGRGRRRFGRGSRRLRWTRRPRRGARSTGSSALAGGLHGAVADGGLGADDLSADDIVAGREPRRRLAGSPGRRRAPRRAPQDRLVATVARPSPRADRAPPDRCALPRTRRTPTIDRAIPRTTRTLTSTTIVTIVDASTAAIGEDGGGHASIFAGSRGTPTPLATAGDRRAAPGHNRRRACAPVDRRRRADRHPRGVWWPLLPLVAHRAALGRQGSDLAS